MNVCMYVDIVSIMQLTVLTCLVLSYLISLVMSLFIFAFPLFSLLIPLRFACQRGLYPRRSVGYQETRTGVYIRVVYLEECLS